MKPGETERDDPKYGTKRGGVTDDEFLVEMRDRYEQARDATDKGYKRALEHMKFAFVPGNQWDEWMSRTRAKRPMYEVNKIRQALKQITNDQRQNRPQAQVRPARDATVEMAEMRQGMLRGIEANSRADNAYDTAFQFAVGGGFGCWRIATEYADEGSFDQDILIQEVANPYAVHFDPTAKEKDRRDGRFAFVEEDIPRTEFKSRYPNADMVAFEGNDTRTHSWWTDESIKLAEYWYKTTEEREILQLSDGRVVKAAEVTQILDELEQAGITVEKRRTVLAPVVKHCVVSGNEVLDGPNDWDGKFIPLVPVWGNILNLEGKDEFCGETAFAEGAQRMHNYERSIFIEVLAKQPLSPFFATPGAIEGFEKQYERIGTDDPPVLLYNADPSSPNGGMPIRTPPPTFPAALAQAAQMSADDIKATTGKHDASLGAKSNETSGKAILARQREGDVSSFDYIDNLSKAMLYSFEIVDDLLPHIYDTQRTVRIIGADDAEKVLEINQPVLDQQTGQWVEVNELARGKYAIAVTVGPSFTTQRQETAEAMMQLSNDPSPLGMLAKYGFIQSLDSPGMEDIRKGARKVLMGLGLLEPTEEDGPQQEQGPPPEVQQAMQQVQEQGMQVQEQAAQVQQAMQELHQAQAAMDKQQADIESAIKDGHCQDKVEKANLQTQRAQLDAQADKMDAARQILEARFNELQAQLASVAPQAPEADPYVQSAQQQLAETMQGLMQAQMQPRQKQIRVIRDENGMIVGAESDEVVG